jgi:hypothetical protein
MVGPLRDKPVLPGEIPRHLDEPLTDSNLQSSFSDGDNVQEEVLYQEAGDNEDLCKGHLITALMLSYKAFNYWLVGLRQRLFCKVVPFN